MTSGATAPRLFVAVWPPPAVMAAIDALPRPSAPGVVWEPPGLAHVTMRFLGPCDPDTAVTALTTLRSPSATAVLGPHVTMLGSSVVCVPVAGLDGLAADVLACTGGIGQPSTHREFMGHVTVARVRRGAVCPLVGHRVAASWGVSSVALVRSHLPTATDPVRRYTTVATFDLEPGSTPGP